MARPKRTSEPEVSPSRARVGRPPLPASERREHRLNLTLDEEMLGWLEARAARRDETLHTCAAALVRKRMRTFLLVGEPPRELALQISQLADTLEVIIENPQTGSSGDRALEPLRVSLEQLCELLQRFPPGRSL